MSDRKLLWVDLEMTGLDPDKDRILEIACLVTDKKLNVLDEGFEVVIHQNEEVINLCDNFVRGMHEENGLLEKVRESDISEEQAFEQFTKLVKKYGERELVIAGNSVHADKSFIDKYIPKASEHMHYRIVDVSTIKELIVDWYPELPGYEKGESHRAKDDILESIGQLRYYWENCFRS